MHLVAGTMSIVVVHRMYQKYFAPIKRIVTLLYTHRVVYTGICITIWFETIESVMGSFHNGLA